jgi:hypothetical protein
MNPRILMGYHLAAFGLLLAHLGGAQDAPFPAPKSMGASAEMGRHIQRTMTLLATSTPEKRHTVKILFYGQSITEQDWWKTVAADLRKRFPNANLIIENRAIGGFASQLLVKTAETDLYSFYPDLMIFYVYGSHIEYENIIQRTRQRSTAEILMQTDHVTNDADLTEETDRAKLTPKQWTPWMNCVFLPDTAAKYGCGVVDQHNLWKQYLKETGLPASRLLRDGVHLNAHGNYLMAELVKAQLVKRQEPAVDPMNCDKVKTFNVGQDVTWRENKLTLEFDGNRVDVITPGATASVRIDGKRPSEFPELYGLTRTTAYPGSIWPCLLRITSEKPRLVEDWTLTVREASPDLKNFKFEVRGSKTGPDGEGTGDKKFVSNSGRVAIDPADWNFDYCLKVFKRPLPANFKIQWKVVPQFLDEIGVASPGLSVPGIEPALTVAQGLPNGRHTLELTCTERQPISAIRVYRPPLR